MNVNIVDDIDAADKCDRPVHDHYFAVQAAQPVAPKGPGRCLGPELQHRCAGRLKVFDHGMPINPQYESLGESQ